MLKPQDVLITLKLFALWKEDWTYDSLSTSLFMSASEVHAGVKRATAADLIHAQQRTPIVEAFKEFAFHGIRYAYYPERGGPTRGMPTSIAAAPLEELFSSQQGSLVPVWPYAAGEFRGEALAPLYKTVPQAAAQDPMLYELLALVDALRAGRARERAIAEDFLGHHLDTYNNYHPDESIGARNLVRRSNTSE